MLAVAAVLAVTGATWYVAAAQTAAALTGSSASWWYSADTAHQTYVTADGVTQDTVPIRMGQRQGLYFDVYNPSSWTQTVTGFGPPGDLGFADTLVQLSVSTRDPVGGPATLPSAQHYRLPVVIPPHQFRIIRLLWTSGGCLQVGTAEGLDRVALAVRVGAWRRTEVVFLNGEYALSGLPATACP